MTKAKQQMCKKIVSRPGMFRGTGCQRVAATDGFCRQHHPKNVESRNQANLEKWRIQWAEDEAKREKSKARCAAEQEVIACAKSWWYAFSYEVGLESAENDLCSALQKLQDQP